MPVAGRRAPLRRAEPGLCLCKRRRPLAACRWTRHSNRRARPESEAAQQLMTSQVGSPSDGSFRQYPLTIVPSLLT